MSKILPHVRHEIRRQLIPAEGIAFGTAERRQQPPRPPFVNLDLTVPQTDSRLSGDVRSGGQVLVREHLEKGLHRLVGDLAGLYSRSAAEAHEPRQAFLRVG